MAYGQEENNYIDYIKVYQRYISHIRGGECQMYPSCSNYGLIAFKSYNPIKAMAMTSDRVLRCSHDFRYYDITLADNKFKLLDLPLNDDNIKKQIVFKKETVTYPISDKNDTCDFGFINYLMLQKDYREALLEINRKLYANKGICPEIYVNYIKCKRALNESEDAIFKFDNSFPDYLKTNDLANLEVGNCYIDLGENSKAKEYYVKATFSTDSIIIDKSNMLIALSLSNEKKFLESKEFFSNISLSSPYYYNSQKAISILETQKGLKYKKPFIAGSLSIIPGLGYLYSGHKSSAISSIIVNGLLAYAFYSNIKSENYGMASLVGVFSFSFYIGNISGSVKSTKRFNETLDRKIINQIKSNVSY